MQQKRSFFQKLTGSYPFEEDDEFAIELNSKDLNDSKLRSVTRKKEVIAVPDEDEASADEDVGELAVDVFQTSDSIIIQAMVAGMHPSKLDVQIGREMVTIRGERTNELDVMNDDYFFQELYWGTFSRTIALPEEVDPDLAEATEKNGLLTIILPKLNKHKIQKVRVKST